jgi:hypothetical protein
MQRFVFSLIVLVLVAASASAADRQLKITVGAGQHDRTNTPVKVALPASVAAQGVTLATSDGQALAAQLTTAAVSQQQESPQELHFILPSLPAGKSATLTATLSSVSPAAQSAGFAWHDTSGEYAELSYGSPARSVLRYMYKPLDESSKEAREQTFKVFHHLFDPNGKQLVTKGPGGQFTHHRGLFFGFNRVTYGDGRKADVWHCSGDAHQSHEGFLTQEAGPVLGRHRVAVDWHGVGKEVFAKEQRELTVYNVPGGHLVEFASQVRTTGVPVRLDGDPQHAGFHFRAAQEVAESTKGQTYYLRTDGQGKPGETRNWDPKSGQGPVNLPWNAMSFVVGGQRYTAVYLDHPRNPKEARYSERDYGRFGSYFEYDLTEDKPLVVNYRLWLQPGELTIDQAAALSANFVEPVTVRIEP